jgi:hypothetical protein
MTMNNLLSLEQKNQFSEILEELGNSLDITESEYEAAVKSYQAVGKQLTKEDSILAPYYPDVLPQGSFMLGTMIRPISEEDDLDIDLVCQLKKKNPFWTQKLLKQETGDQIKANETYRNMLQSPEGRRCWTLKYREKGENPKEKYHMDILPSLVAENYNTLLKESLSRANDISDIDALAIRITDRFLPNYTSETNKDHWMKSNPFGYGKWFFFRANISKERMILLNEAIQAVPKYSKHKLPLQRVVQILKRHRDILYLERDDKEDKPISIIITTLAAQAYEKETSIIDALINVVSKMRSLIEEKNSFTGRPEKWIRNPVNPEENFADKWKEHPKREKNFYEWLDRIEADIQYIISQKDKGLQNISESMVKPFGKDVITRTFSHYAEALLKKREDGTLKMAAGTGLLGSMGRTNIPQHNPFGENE